MHDDHPIEVRLLRHGETVGYDADLGLTERGTAQARAAAAVLRAELDGAEVALRHAPSARARATAEALHAALREGGAAVGEPAADAGFANFTVSIAGRVQDHNAAHAQLRAELEAAARGAVEAPAEWLAESLRFIAIHRSGGDPIGYWLTQPMLSFEPPASAARRYWRALRELARAGLPLTVVAAHSGPMRALAASALGHDPGEPEHLEAVVVRLDAAGEHATLTYREETRMLPVPWPDEPRWSLD